MAAFDGGSITSNAGALLLRGIDRSIGLFDRVAACFTDRRDPRLTEHSVHTLVAQRITGIALGYEDLNDHDFLRHDLAARARHRRDGRQGARPPGGPLLPRLLRPPLLAAALRLLRLAPAVRRAPARQLRLRRRWPGLGILVRAFVRR